MNPEVTGFTICFDGQDLGKQGFDSKSREG